MIKFVAYFLAALAAGIASAAAHSHKKGGLEVVHPWTIATPSKDVRTIAVYMTIKNRGGKADRLLSASSPLAGKIDLYRPDGGDGEPGVAAQFAIPAGTSLELKRDGPHLVLSGVKRQLDAYQDFKLTLVFEKAGRLVVDVAVEEAGTEAPHKH